MYYFSNIFILICIAKGTRNPETNYELFRRSLLQSMPKQGLLQETHYPETAKNRDEDKPSLEFGGKIKLE